jgi:oligopeptide/dipeptide ABC transporter ATP-binding protein
MSVAGARPVLEVRDLRTQFHTDDGVVQAVNGVSFDLGEGEALGIVGESGCGKSVTALSIMGLVQEPGRVVGGEINFRGRDLLRMSAEDVREIRGRDIAMIFQDPLSSLNPVLRNGFQIEEAILAHRRLARNIAEAESVELLERVRVPAAEQRAKDYPHQLSGGMRQRTMIAMGLANQPAVLIADEPTTALDVTVQAQILELLRDLNNELRTSIIMITHNLGVVAGLCTRVIVMYAGQIVEEGPVDDIFDHPQHPYTWALLRSVPRIDALRSERLRSIEGLPPDLIRPPAGCRFHPRCPFRVDRCFHEEPPLEELRPAQRAACWVTMGRAYAEMGAADLLDVRPGSATGVKVGEVQPGEERPDMERPDGQRPDEQREPVVG